MEHFFYIEIRTHTHILHMYIYIGEAEAAAHTIRKEHSNRESAVKRSEIIF